MKRFIIAATIFVGVLLSNAGASWATTLVPGGTPLDGVHSRDAWACIIVEHVDLGVCQGNPFSQ